MLIVLSGATAALSNCSVSMGAVLGNDTVCGTLINVESGTPPALFSCCRTDVATASLSVNSVVVEGISQAAGFAVVETAGASTFLSVFDLVVRDSIVGSLFNLMASSGATTVNALLVQDVKASRVLAAQLSSDVETVISSISFMGIVSEHSMIDFSTLSTSSMSALVSLSSLNLVDWDSPSFAISCIGSSASQRLVLNASDWYVESLKSSGSFLRLEHANAFMANMTFWDPVLNSLVEADHSTMEVQDLTITSGNFVEAAFFLSGKTELSVSGLQAYSLFLNEAFIRAEYSLGLGQHVSVADSLFENLTGAVFLLQEVPFDMQDTAFVNCTNIGQVLNEREFYPVVLSRIAVDVEHSFETHILSLAGPVEISDCAFLSTGALSTISISEASFDTSVSILNSSFVDTGIVSKVQDIVIDSCGFWSSISAAVSVMQGTVSSLRLDSPLETGSIVSSTFTGLGSFAFGSPSTEVNLPGALQISSAKSAIVTLSDCVFDRTVGHYGGAINVAGASMKITDTKFA